MLTKVEKTFVAVATLIAVLFFGVLMLEASKLGNEKALWDIIDPNVNHEFLYIYIAVAIILAFHFLCSYISGTVTRIKLWDHDNTYFHVKASGTMEDSEFYVYPSFDAREISIPRRWDDSSAVLEEKQREYPIGLFFFRNLVQTCFVILMSMLFIYLMPALVEIGKSASSFAMIFTILQWLIFAWMVGLIAHSVSAREYEFDCMDEELESWRNRYTAMLVIFSILIIGYFVLILIGGVKAFFESLVFSRIVTCFLVFILLSIGAFLLDIVMRPKEKERTRRNKDVFAFSSQHPMLPDDRM